MPRIVSIPSRGIEVEFPDSLPDEEIDAYLQEKYPRSGQDVAFEVEQATQQTLEGQNLVNPFDQMSNDDYVLYRQHLAEKKTSLGDALGIAAETAGKILGEVGTGLAATGEAALAGEFGQAAESMGEGMVAGTVGLADIADKILNPANKIPSKEEFLNGKVPTGEVTYRPDTGTGIVGPVGQIQYRPATEADYATLIEQEKARDRDATNRLFAMEATLQGAPVEEVARAFQYVDPTLLAGGASALARAGAKTLFKTGARGAAQTAARSAGQVAATTAPGPLAQAALGAVERGAGAAQTVAGLPAQVIRGVGSVAENIMPGTGLPLQASAVTAATMSDMGLTAGVLGGAATAEKAAEVAAAAARAARGEASRAGLLERVAQDATVSPTARRLAAGLAQIQPALGVAKRVTAQAVKEGAAGAAMGASLGYLAERNLEGAAAGAGAGAAFGGISGTFRSAFRAGREALGYSTERTARQAIGDINSFIAERPEIEQGAWAATMSRLVEKIGPEKAAAQADALRIAEANGGKVRVATPDEVKQWQNPGWMNVDSLEVVLNPERILGDTPAHEATHVMIASSINRAFRSEIENAIYGAADPVTGEIVRPGLFTDPDLARIADQIADSYGKNTTPANEFRGYANRLRNTTDPAALSEARDRVADEFTAMYSGKLQGRLRAGRFNPDRLPLVYRRVLNSIEDGIVEKLRTTLFEQGMDLGFNAARGAFTDSKGRPVRIPELDAIIKRAMQPSRRVGSQAKASVKPDLIPTNINDRAIWARSYGGARAILNDDLSPKSVAQMEQEKLARWQDMTSRLSALPENERFGLEFTRDKKGNTVMTAKGQLSDAAINQILSSGSFDPSSIAVLREVLSSMKNFDKATFDTRYYSVYDRGKRSGKMAAGVQKVSMDEILPYSVEANSQQGVIIRAVDMTTVRERLMKALKKPQFKGLYGNAGDALKDFRAYLTNLTNINAIPSETLLGGGVRGAQKRNLFYDALGFRLRNNETLLNAPAEVVGKAQDTLKSYRVERFAKLVDSGERLAFEEATTYERAMKNFQPDAFTKETLPNGEAMTNPDGYRILKKTGSKLFRVYDDKGELIGTASTEAAAMKKAQSDAAKKVTKEAQSQEVPILFPESNRLTNLNPNGGSWSAIQRENPGLRPTSTKVQVFRATIGDKIRRGDFVAVNRKIAQEHLRSLNERGETGKIITQEVELNDLLMANDATEFIYAPIEKNGKPVGDPTSTKRFQPVSPEQDAAYLRAAQAGDTATAQRLVDEAAKAAGYNITSWHGSNQPGADFNYYLTGRGGYRFFSDFDHAKSYAGDRGTMRRSFLLTTKPLNVRPVSGSRDYTPQEVRRLFQEKGVRYEDIKFKGEAPLWSQLQSDGVKEALIQAGYDSILISETDRGDITRMVFGPEQIKSADPITYDNAGNVIPLSQRFNVESPDIRFQPDAASPSILNGSNGTRIIKSPSGKFRIYSVTGTLLGIRDTEQAAQKLAKK